VKAFAADGPEHRQPSASPQAKIALFRSLFRGREDIYPRRFESRKTGKAGYAPACANEWVRGICEKPRVKFQALYQELISDESRKRRIRDTVIESAHSGRSPLVLTERNDHLDRLEALLATEVRHVVARRRRRKRGGHGPRCHS
jgi:hypothetical protein